MADLVKLYKIFRNQRPVFSVADLFDWYDGPISGIVDLTESKEQYFFETMAFQFDTKLKVYGLAKAYPHWVKEIKNTAMQDTQLFESNVKSYLEQYSDDTFLFKAKHIDSLECEMIKTDWIDLLPYKSFEDVVNQSETETQKWFKYFSL